MTVAELIALLQEQPQDAPVSIGFTIYDGDYSDEVESPVTSVWASGHTPATTTVIINE